jgi:hypothetical protein
MEEMRPVTMHPDAVGVDPIRRIAGNMISPVNDVDDIT